MESMGSEHSSNWYQLHQIKAQSNRVDLRWALDICKSILPKSILAGLVKSIDKVSYEKKRLSKVWLWTKIQVFTQPQKY